MDISGPSASKNSFICYGLGVLKNGIAIAPRFLLESLPLAPLYPHLPCHFLHLHGRADETFPAVADILAIGCLLAVFARRLPNIKPAWAAAMLLPVVLVPVDAGRAHFHITPALLFVYWPLMHLSIAGILLHVVRLIRIAS